MMTSVLDGDSEEHSPLLMEANAKAGTRLSRLLFVVGFAHLVACLGCLVFWLTVAIEAVTLGELIVPAAWALLACFFGSPVAVNFVMVALKLVWKGEASDYELLVFRRVEVARLLMAAGLLGFLCGLAALMGGLMGQEYPAAGFAMLHVMICFSLSAFSARVVAVNVRVEQTNLYRDAANKRSSAQTALWYSLIGLACCCVLLFLMINGTAAFRLFGRGFVFRHEKPSKEDYFSIGDGDRMFYLDCKGRGAGPDSDVVLLLDADMASSSYGWAWLAPSLSKFWRTCVFDRPGYGWSSVGDPPRTVVRETDDLLLALNASGMDGSRFVYISHGLSSWNGLLFQSQRPDQVVAMVFIDPFDPRNQNDNRERERLSFVSSFGYAGMLVNAFGFLRPFFYLMTYFRPAFDLPERVLSSFIDSISRQAFWETMVQETLVLSLSGNQTLKRFPFSNRPALGNLPVAVWSRAFSQSAEYFAALSTSTFVTNMTDDENHFFIFEKQYADQIVRMTSDLVEEALNRA